MNFVIACGGTGGHLFPGLAVAEALKERGHDVLLFVSSKEIDRVALKDYPWLKAEKLSVTGMPGLLSPKIFGFVWRFFSSLCKCLQIYRGIRPACVLSMGGFTAAPPVLAGWMRGIPGVVHDSNAIPGKANLLVARFSSKVALGLDVCKKFFPGKSVEITGTPVRKSLKDTAQIALSDYGLTEGKKTILVMGGSQGAGGINEAILRMLPLLGAEHPDQWQFIHLTGPQDEQRAREAYQKAGVKAFVAAFSGQMGALYRLADVAVSRSGAASMTELSFFGIPTLFIPYPHAADDHQRANAQVFVGAGAALMLTQHEASGERVMGRLESLLEKHDEFSKNARALFIENAEVRVADVMEDLCR